VASSTASQELRRRGIPADRVRLSVVTYPMRQLQEPGAPYPFGRIGAAIKTEMFELASHKGDGVAAG
jgi:hypothetical protein